MCVVGIYKDLFHRFVLFRRFVSSIILPDCYYLGCTLHWLPLPSQATDFLFITRLHHNQTSQPTITDKVASKRLKFLQSSPPPPSTSFFVRKSLVVLPAGQENLTTWCLTAHWDPNTTTSCGSDWAARKNISWGRVQKSLKQNTGKSFIFTNNLLLS